MTKILVPPEVLIQVSQQFHQASLQFEWTVNQLNYQMDTMLLWEGTTRQRFYADYDRARLDLKRVIELMESVSVELKGISIKFRLLDEEVSSKIASSGRSEAPPEPKTWQDHAEGLWEGVKTGGKIIADSLVSTGEALVEDPVGTIGDMAYNATIGTVEEVIDTSVWGAKMAFDVGDTREKFEESVNAAGGTSQFIGQQSAMIAGGLALRRVGVKNRSDSVSVRGSSKGVKGTSEVNPLFRTGSNSERVAIDSVKFDRMKAQFEWQGGIIMQGPEVTARLDKYQAEASNIGPDIIMHRENPTTSAVFEEFIHSTQNRTGRATGDNWLQMEIEAQEKLIRYRKAYGIPNNETRQTIQALRDYRILLSEE
ncbi:WXG100 family type VII secretion target [Paenibacillus lemnae]|uniref:WXG100 family type VII secretion target n=1 Tax=Paenibacillus lemnae TaxID=1330551 RepID=A0A848M422_PAELE|nr:WXG100 family type VII secretion target [Paenibacillus lemnae]NMO94991.1 WXG100 family type VII secretion target [Paenibacillus lemnae]